MVMFFVCLYVLSVLTLAVFVVVDLQLGHDGSGPGCWTDASSVQEGI